MHTAALTLFPIEVLEQELLLQQKHSTHPLCTRLFYEYPCTLQTYYIKG